MVFVCDICGYEYNPDAGDPDNGVEPGTAFADLPDDWLGLPIMWCRKRRFRRRINKYNLWLLNYHFNI